MTTDTYMGDGGPWHPAERGRFGDDVDPIQGGSVRDYFAAHAPDWPQPWFQIEPHAPKPQAMTVQAALNAQPQWGDLNATDSNILRNWMEDGIFELEPHLAPIGEAARALYQQHQAATKDWEERYEHDRFFAWRWYYADRMLRGRRS